MGLFNWLSRNGKRDMEDEIPEDLFIEKNPPTLSDSNSTSESHETPVNGVQDSDGIEGLYQFMREDYESRGFDDAMTNPDSTYREDNIELLRHELHIRIEQVENYYSDLRNSLIFHIDTRKRSGLVDMVDALERKLELLDTHSERLDSIKVDAKNHQGMSERIILSYKRGFSRGLASLSHAEVLNKKL